MCDPEFEQYDPDDHPLPEPYDEFYENRETRFPVSTFPGGQPEHVDGQLSLEGLT